MIVLFVNRVTFVALRQTSPLRKPDQADRITKFGKPVTVSDMGSMTAMTKG
ncbi:MAG: hypothetical protein ABJP34_07490 [Erythrobacter sp.]